MSGRVERGVEHQSSIEVPVAVDVLRSGGLSACGLVVGNLSCHGVACGAEPDVRHYCLHCFLEIASERSVKVVSERRFQSRVTLGDVEWITVVGDVDKVGHARLRRSTAIAYAQIGNLVEPVAEVECRGDVEDVPYGIYVFALIVLSEVG